MVYLIERSFERQPAHKASEQSRQSTGRPSPRPKPRSRLLSEDATVLTTVKERYTEAHSRCVFSERIRPVTTWTGTAVANIAVKMEVDVVEVVVVEDELVEVLVDDVVELLVDVVVVAVVNVVIEVVVDVVV